MYGMGGMGMGGGGARKTYQLDQNYNFPVVAMKDLTEYQPHDYTFALSQRMLFDVSKIDKSIQVLNGDIGEDDAKAQAKTLVDQVQSQKAHDAASHDPADTHRHGRLGRRAAPRPGLVRQIRPQGEQAHLRPRRELWGSHQQHRALGLLRRRSPSLSPSAAAPRIAARVRGWQPPRGTRGRSTTMSWTRSILPG